MLIRKLYVHILAIALLLTGLSSMSFGADLPQIPQFPDGTHTLTFDEGDSMIISAVVPDNIPPGKTLGLILAFHGWGGNSTSMIQWPLLDMLGSDSGSPVYPGLDVLDDYVIIGLSAKTVEGVDFPAGEGPWQEGDFAPTYKTFQWALDNYPIDPRRVHLIGGSRGAFMVTRFVWEHLGDFASVAAYMGAYTPDWDEASGTKGPPLWPRDWFDQKFVNGIPYDYSPGNYIADKRYDYRLDFSDYSMKKLLHLAGKDSTYIRSVQQAAKWRLQSKYLPGNGDSIKTNQKINIADSLPEFYHMHGDADDVIEPNVTRSYTRGLAKKGIRFIYRELIGGDHWNVGKDHATQFGYIINSDALAWMHATRNENFPLSAAQKATLESFKNDIGALHWGPARDRMLEVARIGGREAGEAFVFAFANNLDAGAIQGTAAHIAATTKFGPAVTAALIGNINHSVGWVAGAAITTLGVYAKWRQPEARTFLINAALDTDLAPEIRVKFIEALGIPFSLMKLGNMHDDKEIVDTLIALLHDPNYFIQKAAHDILKTTSALIGDPDPDNSGWRKFEYTSDVDGNFKTGGGLTRFWPGGTPAQNSWVLEQWGFWAAQVTAPLLSDNFVKKPLK